MKIRGLDWGSRMEVDAAGVAAAASNLALARAHSKPLTGFQRWCFEASPFYTTYNRPTKMLRMPVPFIFIVVGLCYSLCVKWILLDFAVFDNAAFYYVGV